MRGHREAHARRQRDVGPVVHVALAAGRAGHLQRLRDGRGVGAPHAERVPDAVQVRAAPQRLVQAGVDEAQRHAQHEVRREAQEVGAQDVARRRAELDLARHDELGPGLAADVQFVDRVLDGRAPRPQLAAQRLLADRDEPPRPRGLAAVDDARDQARGAQPPRGARPVVGARRDLEPREGAAGAPLPHRRPQRSQRAHRPRPGARLGSGAAFRTTDVCRTADRRSASATDSYYKLRSAPRAGFFPFATSGARVRGPYYLGWAQ